MIFFLDTSICIDVLRINGPYRSFKMFESLVKENTGYLSVISVAELSAGASLSTRRDAMKKTEELFMQIQRII